MIQFAEAFPSSRALSAAEVSDFRESFDKDVSSHARIASSRGPRARVANFAPLVGRPPADFLLNRIQGSDALDRFGRNRRAVHFHQVVELAADMGQARSFLYAPVRVELMEVG
jgi:hypothetical protein